MSHVTELLAQEATAKIQSLIRLYELKKTSSQLSEETVLTSMSAAQGIVAALGKELLELEFRMRLDWAWNDLASQCGDIANSLILRRGELSPKYGRAKKLNSNFTDAEIERLIDAAEELLNEHSRIKSRREPVWASAVELIDFENVELIVRQIADEMERFIFKGIKRVAEMKSKYAELTDLVRELEKKAKDEEN